MKMLVTGGTGFIGSHVVDLLSQQGHQVTVVDLQPPGPFWEVPSGVKIVNMDVADKEFEDLINSECPEVIFHLAARASVIESIQNPYEDARTTIEGTLRVLEGARKAGSKKVIFSSTAAVYGNATVTLPIREDAVAQPISPYGTTKLAAEQYLRIYRELYGLDYAVLRYANVYGPRQGITGEGGVIAIFSRAIARGETLRLFGDGLHTRDYIYVTDVARANWMAAQAPGSVFCNVSTGIETSNRQLLQMLGAHSGRDINVREEPERPGDIRHSSLSPGRAEETLGFRAQTPIDNGLYHTYQWMEKWA